MFRAHRKYSSGGTQRAGLRDITNTAGNAVKPVSKKASSSAFFRPLPNKQHRSDIAKGATAQRSASSSTRAPRASTKPVIDEIDRADVNDPQCAVEYVQDIQNHFRAVEGRDDPSPSYMSQQPHINEKMRAILIDWLVEVHLKFKLVPETLYLTVIILDRYLDKKQVARNKLQLVGVTALLIASKYEEIYPPEIRDLVYITDRAYNKPEILQMERTMLDTLGFSITCPTIYVFLERFLKAAHADSKQSRMAKFITERTLQEYSMLNFKPSMIAASAVNLARRALCVSAWTPLLEKHTLYSESALNACTRQISTVMNNTSNLQAVKKKYTSSKFECVASIAVPRLQ